MMRRALGILFGVATQLVFGVTVFFLYRYLAGHSSAQATEGSATNIFLALQFAVPHSILLHPSCRQKLGRWITREFYGLFFCCVTCGSLWLNFIFWRPHHLVLWECSGVWATLMHAAFLCSWIALFYSLSLNGLGYQTGLTPWWYWLRRQPQPVRRFIERGAYRWMRHPIYLSFLGLLWFTPTVTLDRAILTVIWTIYIFVGSWLKDRRLVLFLGDQYRDYQQRVPGYPGVTFGPLGRVMADNFGSGPSREIVLGQRMEISA